MSTGSAFNPWTNGRRLAASAARLAALAASRGNFFGWGHGSPGGVRTVITNVDASTTGQTVTLAAASLGGTRQIVKTDSTYNPVLIVPAGSDQIDGHASCMLTAPNQSVTLGSTGSAWTVQSQSTPTAANDKIPARYDIFPRTPTTTSFPTRSNSGVPSGFTPTPLASATQAAAGVANPGAGILPGTNYVTKNADGSINVTGNGAVIDGIDFSAGAYAAQIAIAVNGNDCLIKRCVVGSGWGGCINQTTGKTGLIVQDSDIVIPLADLRANLAISAISPVPASGHTQSTFPYTSGGTQSTFTVAGGGTPPAWAIVGAHVLVSPTALGTARPHAESWYIDSVTASTPDGTHWQFVARPTNEWATPSAITYTNGSMFVNRINTSLVNISLATDFTLRRCYMLGGGNSIHTGRQGFATNIVIEDCYVQTWSQANEQHTDCILQQESRRLTGAVGFWVRGNRFVMDAVETNNIQISHGSGQNYNASDTILLDNYLDGGGYTLQIGSDGVAVNPNNINVYYNAFSNVAAFGLLNHGGISLSVANVTPGTDNDVIRWYYNRLESTLASIGGNVIPWNGSSTIIALQ